jgi:hypothetical protein
MNASLDALIRAIDALKEPALERRKPQGATREATVAPAKPLESQQKCHKGHRSHSKTTDHGPNYQIEDCNVDVLTQTRSVAAPKIYLSGVAPVAHVAPDIDSKGKNRGHTLNRCGPLWPFPGSPRLAAPADVPTEWADGVAKLADMPCPVSFPAAKWAQVLTDAAAFLQEWAAAAHRLGWPAGELFGCHRRAPWGRIQGMGLVLLLQGDEIAALTATEAVIRTPAGAHQIYRRKPADPLHPAERCLVWELDTADGAPLLEGPSPRLQHGPWWNNRMNAERLLERASDVVARRRGTYGRPIDLFEHLARWSLVLGIKVTPAQAVLCLIDLKLARLAHDPRHLDSVADIAGYLAEVLEDA